MESCLAWHRSAGQIGKDEQAGYLNIKILLDSFREVVQKTVRSFIFLVLSPTNRAIEN